MSYTQFTEEITKQRMEVQRVRSENNCCCLLTGLTIIFTFILTIIALC
jgi:hypothetical protein